MSELDGFKNGFRAEESGLLLLDLELLIGLLLQFSFDRFSSSNQLAILEEDVEELVETGGGVEGYETYGGLLEDYLIIFDSVLELRFY